MGIFSLVFDVADRSYLPSIVQSDKLLEANSRLSVTGSLSEVGGPALAGLLVQIISAPFTLVLDVVSFLWSAFWLGLIRTPESSPVPKKDRKRQTCGEKHVRAFDPLAQYHPPHARRGSLTAELLRLVLRHSLRLFCRARIGVEQRCGGLD